MSFTPRSGGKGDFVWATRVTANIGRGFGYLLIAAGVAMFVFQGSFRGAWLAFLGWFLLNAATAEARYVLTQQALNGVRVRDVMTREVPGLFRNHDRGSDGAPRLQGPVS